MAPGGAFPMTTRPPDASTAGADDDAAGTPFTGGEDVEEGAVLEHAARAALQATAAPS